MPWISYPRVNRLFEVHERSFWDEVAPAADRAKGTAWREAPIPGVPVYVMPSQLGVVPNTVEYPLSLLQEQFPHGLFENSIAYMLAMAVLEKVDVIGLWGVHQLGHYLRAQVSIAYWVGVAEGLGIEVVVAPGSPLLASVYVAGRYGIDEERRTAFL